ncbi:MAG: hypothetical protein HC902_11280 [Calothrix sp. SM1_5_4]|nr:hypothetical protein [Calothrix sp. SM1_5_4]
MVRAILTSMALILTSLTAYANPLELDGHWTRIADSCSPVDDQVLTRLVHSGGTNRMNRRIALHIQDGKFAATSFPSLKCSPDFKATGVELDTNYAECDSIATNSGHLITSGDSLVMVAETREGQNPWGTVFTRWKYRLEHGLLILQTWEASCPRKLIFLVNTPMS